MSPILVWATLTILMLLSLGLTGYLAFRNAHRGWDDKTAHRHRRNRT